MSDATTITVTPQQRATRLALYLNAANSRMKKTFSTFKCLGLNCAIGSKELERLQNAIKRHGREDQFDDLTIPVDVLLRTLSFIPNPQDPRLDAKKPALLPTTIMNHQDKEDQHDDDNLIMPRNTLLRLACSSSTLLYTVMENKNISSDPENTIPIDQRRTATLTWRYYRGKKVAEEKDILLKRAKEKKEQEMEMQRRERERDYAHHRSHGGTEESYEGLPLDFPQRDVDELKIAGAKRMLIKQDELMMELNESRCLLEDIDTKITKSKNTVKKDKGTNLWGIKKKKETEDK